MVKSPLLKVYRLALLIVALAGYGAQARAGESPCAGFCLARFSVEQVTAFQFTSGNLQFTGGAHWQPEYRLGSRFGLMPRIGALVVKSAADSIFLAADAALLLDLRVGERLSFFVGPGLTYWIGPWTLMSFMPVAGGRYLFATPKLAFIDGVQLTSSIAPLSSGMSLFVAIGAMIGF